MSFCRDDTMLKMEKVLGLKGQYREDQSGYPWISNSAVKPGETGFYEAPPLGEDWRRLYFSLYSILDENPKLFEKLPKFEKEPG